MPKPFKCYCGNHTAPHEGVIRKPWPLVAAMTVAALAVPQRIPSQGRWPK